MLKHNILVALRNMRRWKGQFLIHLVGLSFGIASAFIIYLWVVDETSIDKFGVNDDRRYFILENYKFPDQIQTWTYTPTPLAKTFIEEFPDVEHAVAINTFFDKGLVRNGDNTFKAKWIFATQDYFNVFPFKLVAGDKDKALTDIKSVVISSELAMKNFHTIDNVIGKTIDWKHSFFQGTFQVSGVFEQRTNTSFQYDMIFHYDILTNTDQWADKWNGNYAETTVILKEGVDPADFNKKIAGIVTAKFPKDDRGTLFAQQFSKKYLYGNYKEGVQVGGRIEYVNIFTLIAVIIMVIACINFINLSTAQASRRNKEVGVKKAIGVKRKALMFQFLTESTLVAAISFVFAMLLVFLLLPQFNTITNKHLAFRIDLVDGLFMVGIILATAFAAGIYPAFYLSSFKPAAALKSMGSRVDLLARRVLVIVQFTISIVFIVCFIVINQQIDYIQTVNLGFNKDNILQFRRQGDYKWDDYDAFITELKNIPGVVNATSAFGGILMNVTMNSGFTWEGQVENGKSILFPSPVVSHDFIETMGVEVVKGRSFRNGSPSDTQSVIINEAAEKLMGFADPIGQHIKQGDKDLTIVGVVRDFHYGSLHNFIEPLIFRYEPQREDLMVKIQAGQEQNVVPEIKKVYDSFHTNSIFEYTFMDNTYQELYNTEARTVALLRYFTTVAIVISCLGLLGLASFVAQKRFKEVCIRKVYGSSSMNIVFLLSNDFTKTLIIAIFIATPVSYFLANNWLDGFAYRIPLSWAYFIEGSLAALFVAWFTIGALIFRAARTNPASGLKEE